MVRKSFLSVFPVTKEDLDKDNENAQPDFRIDRYGQWFHNGEPIARKALAKLFSDRALKCDENGDYWLQTPYEKYPVEVADVPYIIVDYHAEAGSIQFMTNMEEQVTLGPDNPLELRDFDNDGEVITLPYIQIRDGLYARLDRNTYYALIHAYGTSVDSNGASFSLGDGDV